MPIVQDYWNGVLQRIQAEVDVFAGLVRHQGERGRENELALTRLLESLIPKRHGVGSGLVIDHEDRYSKQMDIIIHKQMDEPALFAQTTQLLFPVESVLCCIEVKTRLTQDDIEDALEKQKSLSVLAPAGGATIPPLILFAYELGFRQPKTLYNHFTEARAADSPCFLCIVTPGIVGGRPDVVLAPPADNVFPIGQVLLYGDDPGTAVEVPDADAPAPLESHAGRLYPPVEMGDRWVLADPARALLLFVEALLRILADLENRPEPFLRHYMDAQARKVDWLPRPLREESVTSAND